MQQPELGLRLCALRKENNMTQEELAEKSHVSVRTIQRVEAGEVTPRMVTVRILLEALGVDYQSFLTQPNETMNTQTASTAPDRNTLLVAAISGIIYLVSEVILGALDVAWFTGIGNRGTWLNPSYIGLTGLMVVSFFLFARGFVAMGALFGNTLLKVTVWLLMVMTFVTAVVDVTTLWVRDTEGWWLPYAAIAVLAGATSIAFGIALIRLQDGMGELARVVGILEILMGFMLVTVVMFFFAMVLLIPIVVIEVVLLYRCYEYLSRSDDGQVNRHTGN